jgi:hypothetical protein
MSLPSSLSRLPHHGAAKSAAFDVDQIHNQFSKGKANVSELPNNRNL